MTRREVRQVIANNPNKQLYLLQGDDTIKIHTLCSKTTLIRNASLLKTFRVSTYIQERPDLKQYYDRGRLQNGDQPIVTFEAI